MRPSSCLLGLLLASSCLAAADIELQRVKFTDGGSMLGLYAADTGTLQMFDERTGRKIGEMHVDPAKVDSVSKVTIAVSDKPAAKPGADGRWMTDVPAARRLAKETKRPILMLFTGSDWCPWCIKLERQITSTKSFKNWAADNVVLVYLDFPQTKQLAPALQQANDAAATTLLTAARAGHVRAADRRSPIVSESF